MDVQHGHEAWTWTYTIDMDSVVDPKLFFSDPDPDPTLTLIPDPARL